MRGTREWQRSRSAHARVLEGLEAAVAAHPASGRRRTSRRKDGDQADEAADHSPAKVIPLRRAGTGSEGPSAA